ncbi:ABC transporter permease [Cognaticolwellia mytili]|uniref:ABC transporter permease n=1 Tax=Cognaticolwellia mytili TaxID=1888913 RepID=UPI000A17654A|nr:ABC transporter permease [Cognaticolwellia mytili]
MNSFFYHIKQAWLSLKQKPGFVFSVVSTMGITLGALICVLTLAYVMLIKPLPYPDQDRLFRVEHQLISNEGKVDGDAYTYPNLMHLYNNQTVFSESVLSYFDAAVLTSIPSEPMMTISFVTPQWFDLFATKLAKGRIFEATEKLNSYSPVAILSYETWQKEFAGKDNVLGEKITFGDKSYRVVGVTAPDDVELPLAGPGYKTQIYLPWDFNPFTDEQRKSWGNDDGSLTFIGKLKPDLVANFSASNINQKLTHLINENWQSHVSDRPFFKDWRINIEVSLVKSYIIGEGKRSVYLLIIGALGLVLIACANIANLFVSRTAERQQQLAIRAAVGASKSQLFKTIMAEIGVVMLLSMLLAQVFSYVGFTILAYSLGGFLPRLGELSLNAFSLLISVSLLVLLTLMFSQLCRRMINYHDLNATLQASGKGNGIQVSKRVRNTLISSQIAIASALVFINIVLYIDAMKLVKQPLGYDTDNNIAVVLSLTNIERSSRAATLTKLKTELRNLPQAAAVSQAMRPSIFAITALMGDANSERYTAKRKDVDEKYFSLINQRLIAGENFSAADIKDDNDVMIINDTFAQRLAPDGNAIGMTFNNGVRIIGIVKSINVPGRMRAESRFYMPASLARNMLIIKVKAGQKLHREEFIKVLKGVNTQLSLFSYAALTDYKSERLFVPITTSIATAVLAILTLLLSALGLFGILSYSSQMRRFEIGTRMAIGAKGRDIVQLVFRDNAGAILSGILVSAILLSTLSVLFNDSLIQYITLTLVPIFMVTLGVILSIAFFACYVPLRQYIRKPAIHSLRGSD